MVWYGVSNDNAYVNFNVMYHTGMNFIKTDVQHLRPSCIFHSKKNCYCGYLSNFPAKASLARQTYVCLLLQISVTGRDFSMGISC